MTGRPLLLAVSLVSVNAALLASASAATCVTDVTATTGNVVNSVTGQTGAAVTGVTPTMAAALTNVTPNTGRFLTSATTFTTANAQAVTSVNPTFGTVTGITPTPGLPTNLMVPAFNPASNPPGTLFTFPDGGNTATNQGTVNLTDTSAPPPGTVTLLNVPVVSGTPTSQQVVTNVSGPTASFLTSATFTPQTASAVTSLTPTSAQFVNGLNVSAAPVLTAATVTTTPVVNSVTGSNSGASASASSLGCGLNA
jgi:hypothetical protein